MNLEDEIAGIDNFLEEYGVKAPKVVLPTKEELAEKEETEIVKSVLDVVFEHASGTASPDRIVEAILEGVNSVTESYEDIPSDNLVGRAAAFFEQVVEGLKSTMAPSDLDDDTDASDGIDVTVRKEKSA